MSDIRLVCLCIMAILLISVTVSTFNYDESVNNSITKKNKRLFIFQLLSLGIVSTILLTINIHDGNKLRKFVAVDKIDDIHYIQCIDNQKFLITKNTVYNKGHFMPTYKGGMITGSGYDNIYTSSPLNESCVSRVYTNSEVELTESESKIFIQINK